MIEPQIVAHFMGKGVEAPITCIQATYQATYQVGIEWRAISAKPGIPEGRFVKGIGKEGIQWA